MKITVDYLGYIKNLLSLQQPEIIELQENAQVLDLLRTLAKKHGEPFITNLLEPDAADLKGNIILTINGLLLNQLKGIESSLKGGDKVVLMPIVSGG